MTDTPQKPPKSAAIDDPLDRAARSISVCDAPFANQSYAAAMRDALGIMCDETVSKRELLSLQSRVLDALFNRMVAAGLYSSYRGDSTAHPGFINDEYIDMALRAQRQCARTIDTISRMGLREKSTNKLKDPQKPS